MSYPSDRSMYDDVADFHRKFNIPVAGTELCRIPDYTIVEYRTKFLEEELQEFRDACAEGSLVKALDALCDLAWVAMGTAHYFRAPWDEAWAEVRRANNDRVLVTPENCPPEKRYRKDMVMKPPGWREPDILGVIREHNVRIRHRLPSGIPSAITLRTTKPLLDLLKVEPGTRLLNTGHGTFAVVGPRWWPRPPAPMFVYEHMSFNWLRQIDFDFAEYRTGVKDGLLVDDQPPSPPREPLSIEAKHPLGCGCDICDPFFDPSN